jgi:hypothetical protein
VEQLFGDVLDLGLPRAGRALQGLVIVMPVGLADPALIPGDGLSRSLVILAVGVAPVPVVTQLLLLLG